MALVNPRRLYPYITMGFEDYAAYTGGVTMFPKREDQKHIFIDRGGDVLAVAHLDTVLDVYKMGVANGNIYSPALDDRLGAYILLDVLPLHIQPFDILLTTNEEKGRSTATYFEPAKDYNWIFSFDRAGTDVVTYQYGSQKTEKMLKGYSIQEGHGTYSDICNLEHLEVVGFNWGTGYRRQHTMHCNAPIRDTVKMIKKFISFYKRYANVRLDYEPEISASDWTFYRETYEPDYPRYTDLYNDKGYQAYLRWAREEREKGHVCSYCGMPGILLNAEGLCKYCVDYS